MMNIGVVVPAPGYLEAVRDLCTKHGVVLIYDEVKSGATIAAGGATERYGVQPDLACFAKAIGGGTPVAAFGGKAEIMEVIEHGAAQQGTFNGNPLVAAAGLAALTEVLTPDAYELLGALGKRLADGCAKAIADTGIPAHTVDLGAKGCVSYRAEPLTNYRDFLETRTELYAASFPWAVNRGVFMTPGRRRAVDDLGAAHRGRHRPLRRRVLGVLRRARCIEQPSDSEGTAAGTRTPSERDHQGDARRATSRQPNMHAPMKSVATTRNAGFHGRSCTPRRSASATAIVITQVPATRRHASGASTSLVAR